MFCPSCAAFGFVQFFFIFFWFYFQLYLIGMVKHLYFARREEKEVTTQLFMGACIGEPYILFSFFVLLKALYSTNSYHLGHDLAGASSS